MKFKIEKYFYKTIFIIFICSNLTLILFHLAYFYKVNNEKQIYFEEKMAKETKQNIKIFHNLLMNVYPNIAEKLKNIHNHVRHSKDFQITKKELKKNEIFNNINFKIKEKYGCEYIIYKRMNKIGEMEFIHSSLPSSIFSCELDKILLNSRNNNQEVVQEIFRNQIVNTLVKISDDIFIISYSGIFNNSDILIGTFAILLPLKKFISINDFILTTELSNNFVIYNNYSNYPIYQSDTVSYDIMYNEDSSTYQQGIKKEKNNDLPITTTCDTHAFFDPLKIKFISTSMLPEVDNENNFLELTLLVLFNIAILILVIKINSSNLNCKLYNLFKINELFVYSKKDNLEKCISEYEKNTKTYKIIDQQELKQYINNIYIYLNKLKLSEIQEHNEKLKNIHKNKITFLNIEKLIIAITNDINFITSLLVDFEDIINKNNEIEDKIKTLSFNIKIVVQNHNLNKINKLNEKANILYNNINLNNSNLRMITKQTLIYFKKLQVSLAELLSLVNNKVKSNNEINS